jgi:bacteriocin biosynthesis cyclodehydratase domain-containing protein
MVLKLDPGIPMVWRTPDSVQFGVDAPVVVIAGVDAGLERLLTALRTGISPSGWDMLARDAAVPAELARDLLARLEPVMHAERAPASGRVLVTGDGPIARALAGLLRDEGVLARADESQPELAVLVTDWVLGPHDAATWLRRDVPHVPIVAADRFVTIGPFVEPGRTPCVYCVQLARTDADPAWPAVATQLWGRAPAALSHLTVLSAACFAARRIRARLDGRPASVARGWRLADAGGTVSAWTARTHPRCSCAAPPESDWAPGPGPATPAGSTTGRAAGGHA